MRRKLGKSVVQSFSYHLSEASTIAAAEDKAREQGKSFSEYLVRLVKEDIEKKLEAPDRLPILNAVLSRQTTITEYDIKLFQPSEERFQNLKHLSPEQHTKLAIDVVHLQNQIRASKKK
jgi:regulator of sirC expression with transglutaminase-like and TPR domain